jgi:hypothetical protein
MAFSEVICTFAARFSTVPQPEDRVNGTPHMARLPALPQPVNLDFTSAALMRLAFCSSALRLDPAKTVSDKN